jgi:hypothetical protein
MPCLYYLTLLAGTHLLYLMTIFYLITTFVVLLAGVEVADKATSGVRHLPNQGAAALRKG